MQFGFVVLLGFLTSYFSMTFLYLTPYFDEWSFEGRGYFLIGTVFVSCVLFMLNELRHKDEK